jgi:hypothetical protein
MAITLSTTDRHDGLVLSNDYTTALATIEGTPQGVRATEGYATGKWYFEATVDALTATDGGVSIGLARSDQSLDSSYLGDGTQHSSAANSTGNIIYNNTNWFNLGVFTSGTVICIAFDATTGPATGKAWWRKAGGLWMNTAGYDPATDTGYLTPATYQQLVYPVVSLYHIDEQVTINFGLTPFQETPPTGFSPWQPGGNYEPVYSDARRLSVKRRVIDEEWLEDRTIL